MPATITNLVRDIDLSDDQLNAHSEYHCDLGSFNDSNGEENREVDEINDFENNNDESNNNDIDEEDTEEYANNDPDDDLYEYVEYYMANKLAINVYLFTANQRNLLHSVTGDFF